MRRKAIIVSHADADGHIIAEQTRRNLASIRSFDVTVVVDPERTKNHKAWLSLDAIHEIEACELVFFVDLMFASASFGAEADALVRFAKSRPEKRFFVLDHHPLPLRRLSAAPNVRALYRDDVFDCTFGPSSDMMIIAALCEMPQRTCAEERKKAIDDDIVRGMRRAAAIGGTLPGTKLLALLRHGFWGEIAKLGRESADKHLLPRGLRSSRSKRSPGLAELDAAATELIAPKKQRTRERTMSYDFESATDRSPPVVTGYAPQPKDLEAIVTILQLAALDLTPTTGTTFTEEELVAKAIEIGGDGMGIDVNDVKIVLGKPGFLKKEGGKLRMK